MSLFSPSDECPTCFGLTGWVGEQTRRHPLRKHLACTCEPVAERADLEPTPIGEGWNRVAA